MSSTMSAKEQSAANEPAPIDYDTLVTSATDPRLLAETMRFIIRKGGTANKKKVIQHIQDTFSFDEKLERLNKSGFVKWRTSLQFHLIGPVKSGFLKRDGSGEWRITDEGRKYAIKSPEELSEACLRGYRKWKESNIIYPGAIKHWRITANSDWDKFYNEGVIGCGWGMVGDIDQVNESDLKRLVKQAQADGKKISVKSYHDLLYLRDMPIDAVVIATDEKKQLVKAVGRVTGPYSFVDDDPIAHRRPVEWIEIEDREVGKQSGTRRITPASDELLAIVGDVAINAAARKFWAMRMTDDESRIKRFQDEGYVGSGFSTDESRRSIIEDISLLSSEEEITASMRTIDPEGPKPASVAASLYKFAKTANTGDIIVLRGVDNRVHGICTISDEYRFNEADDEMPHQRAVRWLSTAPFNSPWPTTSSIFSDVSESTKELENMIDRSPDRDTLLNDLGWSIDEDTSISPAQSIADNSFLEIDETQEILALLDSKRNIILQGAPGTGKTYLARQIAKILASRGADSDRQWTLVQFHQSYGYEDFIEGYRPHSDGNFRIKDGVFKLFCRRAASDPNSKYVFVIDEINRGNLSRIFGELMVLLEHDKRGPEFSMNLAYSGGESGGFYVPANVFIVGLMNTADRSLAVVDYALRRRFAFYALQPRYNSNDFRDYLVAKGVSDTCIERINSTMTELNAAIAESRALGPGFVIGHSFFCPRESSISDGDRWIARVMQYEIKPLLEEYCGTQKKLLDRFVSIVSS